MPELRHLRLFLAVAQERNFTRAAEKLHMAQQAVSKGVAQLERELGVELLERTTREVRLTPAGAALLADGRDALAAVERAFAGAAEVGRGLSGTVRLGATPALGPGRARRRDAGAARRRPGAGGRLPRGAPLRHRADAARPPGRPRPRPHRRHGARRGERGAAAVARDARRARRPPARRARAVALRELDGTRLLVWSPPGTPYTDLLLARVAAGGGRVEPVESRVTGTHGLADLEEHGAVALVPEGWPARPGVRFVALAEELTLPLLILWAAGVPPAAVARLRAALSGNLREQP